MRLGRFSLPLLVAAAVLLGAHLFLPGYVERQLNRVAAEPPYGVDARSAEAYAQIPFVADLHADALLWARDLAERSCRGHMDVPRLLEARVGLQVFSIVTKTPRGQNYASNSDETDNITALMVAQARHPRTWGSLLARGLDMCERLGDVAERRDDFRVIRSASEWRAYREDHGADRKQTAGLLAVEGLHLLEGELANLDRLDEAGVRMVAPVHFFDNALGGSAHGVEKGGLTPFGKTVLAEAEERGMLVDLAHASEALFDEWLDLATRPVVVSHTGVRGTCPTNRNLSDEQLRRVAANGGLVGIGLFAGATCELGAAATARAMRHAVDVMGVRHVALGSDFDGAVEAPFDVTGLPLLVPALRAEGFSDLEVSALLGGNVYAFLLANLPEP